MRVKMFETMVYLAASRNEQGELMLVITNGNYKCAISIYLRRWEIESLFQALKGRGFRFEDTHVCSPERIEKMIALLAIGVAWAHKVGEWRASKKPIPFKNFKNQQRPAFSLFKYGLELIRETITGLKINTSMLRKCIKRIDFDIAKVLS